MKHSLFKQILVLTLMAVLLTPLAAAAEAVPLPAENDAPVRALDEVDIMSPEIRAARNEETIPASLVLGVKETYALSLEGDGIQYATSNKKVATVKKSGVIRAVAPGKAKITITRNGDPVGLVDVVVRNAPDKISLSAEKLRLSAGQSDVLKAKLPGKTASRLYWSSSDESVATVDQDGVVTAVQPGAATIKVRTFNKKAATCAVRVNPANAVPGTAPVIHKMQGEFEQDGHTRTYTYIELSNAIPYVYYEKSGHFSDVVEGIQRRKSNILVITNAHLDKGPIISKGVGYLSRRGPVNVHRSLVVDADGNVAYGPPNATNEDLLKGRVPCISAIDGEVIDHFKAYSAVTGFGYFILNGKVEFTFDKQPYKRPRQIFGVKADGTYVVITTSRNEKGWGWNGDYMVTIAKKHHLVSAYNFDGGNSTETAWRFSTDEKFKRDGASTQRGYQAYLVFTSDNKPPY